MKNLKENHWAEVIQQFSYDYIELPVQKQHLSHYQFQGRSNAENIKIFPQCTAL